MVRSVNAFANAVPARGQRMGAILAAVGLGLLCEPAKCEPARRALKRATKRHSYKGYEELGIRGD